MFKIPEKPELPTLPGGSLPGIVIILLAVSLTYLNSFPGEFHYDDFALFLENPEFREHAQNPLSLLTLYAGRPLSILSLELNLQLGGEDPFWFLLINLILHLAATTSLYFLVIRLSGSLATGFITAFLFTLHPLQAQTVNYIWARSILLMSLLLLLSMTAALSCKKDWPGLALFQLAVWARMDALAGLPLLFLLRRSGRKPLLVLGFLNLAAAGHSMLSANSPDMAWNHSSPIRYLLDAPLNLLRYLGLMIHPVDHSIFHEVSSYDTVKTSMSICLVGIIVLAVIKIRRLYPLPVAGTIWLFVMLSPSILIPNADPVNESRAYLAFAGAALVAAVLISSSGKAACEKLAELTGRSGIRAAGGITALAVGLACGGVLASRTVNRNTVWKEDTRIWQEAVSLNPESHLPVYNLGVALIRSGEFRKGLDALGRAIELNPLDDLSYSSSGYCYDILGETEKAEYCYYRALEINPGNQAALEALGIPGADKIRQ